MRKGIIFLFVIAFCLQANAQVKDMDAAKQGVFQAAKKMDEALINKRFDEYVDANHPDVIAKVDGGRAGFVVQMQQQIETLEKSGNYITAAWPGKPSDIIDTAGEWQCTIPQHMNVRIPGGIMKTETTLIAMSPDKGGKWYFVDIANAKTMEGMRAMFPKLSSRLKAPTPVEPEFVPDPEN